MSGGVVLGQYQDSWRHAIDTMDDSQLAPAIISGHDPLDSIEVIFADWMDWYRARFADDQYVVILMDNIDWLVKYREFMPMNSMGNNICRIKRIIASYSFVVYQ